MPTAGGVWRSEARPSSSAFVAPPVVPDPILASEVVIPSAPWEHNATQADQGPLSVIEQDEFRDVLAEKARRQCAALRIFRAQVRGLGE